MSDHWVVYLFVFVSVSLASFGLYNYYVRERQVQGGIKRRIHSLLPNAGGTAGATDDFRRDRFFSPIEGEFFQFLDRFVLQTGLRFEKNRLLIGILFFATVIAAITILRGPLPAAIFGALGIIASIFWLFSVRARRILKFEEQLPDVIDVIVRSIRAGHPLPAALELVAREIQDPAGAEFGIAYDELAFGLDLRFALENLNRRVGAPDLRFLVTAVAIQSQSGGNLAEILTRLAGVMRERSKLRQKIKAMTAEGRISALALTLLPLIVFVLVLLVNPSYYGELWGTPVFRNVLYLAGGMLAVGNVIMRRMVNFRF